MLETLFKDARRSVPAFAAGYACCALYNIFSPRAHAHEPLDRRLQVVDSPRESSCWLEKRRDSSGKEELITTAFLRLHTLLFKEMMLPVSAFGFQRPGPSVHALRQYVGKATKYSRGNDGVTAFTQRATSRVAFVRFLGRQMETIGPKVAAAAAAANRTVRCLEWDGRWYLSQYSICQDMWTYVFSARGAATHPVHQQLVGDLLKMPTQHSSFVGTFDVIFCNQVFEHVARPWVAATSLAAMLQPGGYLVWTAPFMEPTHGVPYDFFRYTISGGATLFKDAGLSIVAMERGGDSMLTSAYLLGFSPAEIGNDTRVAEALSSPVTLKELERAAADGDKAALAQKLYFSSFLVAQAPRHARARGGRDTLPRPRRVWSWKLEQVDLQQA